MTVRNRYYNTHKQVKLLNCLLMNTLPLKKRHADTVLRGIRIIGHTCIQAIMNNKNRFRKQCLLSMAEYIKQ